jgi:hypothetical protein
MASRNRKTTMAKLNREARLRERRLIKEASKEARKRERGDGPAAQAQSDLTPAEELPTDA